nr:hypothetical protein [Prevotella sp.]
RLEATPSLPPRGEERTKSLPYWGRLVGAVACLLIIVGIGVTLLSREESHDVVKPRQTVVVKKETKTDATQPETKVTETPKAVAVAESKTIRKPKKKAAPMQVAFQKQEDSSKAPDGRESEKQRSPAEGNGNLITHNSSLQPAVLTERDIPITRPENYRYTPEEIALLKKQADDAYVKWVQLELEIAKYNLEQMAQQ